VFLKKRAIKSDFLWLYLGLLGGLWNVLVRAALGSMKGYFGFQTTKSAVRYLYYYTRTKQLKKGLNKDASTRGTLLGGEN